MHTEFGIALSTEAARANELVDLAVLADSLGLDLVGVIDHPYAGTNLDAWSMMSVIAARTSRIRVFPDVANLPLRPPAMLAKAAATLDLLSGGRVEVGIGAGAFAETGGGGMGGPRRTPAEAVAAVGEAIEVIRGVWSAGPGPVSYEGAHYRLDGVVPGPAPVHPMQIWVGAYRPRMIELAGRLADGWVGSSPYVDAAGVAGIGKRLDDAAEAAGRSPGDVRRIYNAVGAVVPNGDKPFFEGVEAWVERVTGLVLEQRVSGLLFMPATDPARQIEILANEVVPAVREAVDRERARS